MIKAKYAVIIFFLFINNSFAGDEGYKLIKSLPVTVTHFTTDHTGNCYIINNGQVFKYDNKGVLFATYSDKFKGAHQTLDASNPFKVLLFDPDFGVVRILDSKLTLLTTIDLRSLGILQATLACKSNNEGGIWVFDKTDLKLKKIDDNLKVIYESVEMNKIYKICEPNFLIETDQFVLLNNPTAGVLVYDMAGVYYQTIEIQNKEFFQVQQNRIYYVENNTIIACYIGDLSRTTQKIPPIENAIAVRHEPHRVFILKKGVLEIYSF